MILSEKVIEKYSKNYLDNFFKSSETYAMTILLRILLFFHRDHFELGTYLISKNCSDK